MYLCMYVLSAQNNWPGDKSEQSTSQVFAEEVIKSRKDESNHEYWATEMVQKKTNNWGVQLHIQVLKNKMYFVAFHRAVGSDVIFAHSSLPMQ